MPPTASLLDRIKHIQIGKRTDTYLTLGAEVRLYTQNWSHTVLGRTPGDFNYPVQTRLRLLADLHVTQYFRAYLEFGDNREFGQHFTNIYNRDRLDLYQVFADITAPLGRYGKITLRPGRYEMPLGNGKLVGLREGTNVRFTYEGLRATYILPGVGSVDGFAVRPVLARPSEFDDHPDYNVFFKGVYVSIPKGIGGIGNDVYWYKVDRNSGITREAVGRDQRNNWGVRVFNRNKRWDFDLEGDYQSGVLKNQDISAWAVLFDGGYTFPHVRFSPRLGVRSNIFSGDGNLKNSTAGTFVAAFPRLPLISDAAFFNFSNLADVYPSVTLKPMKDVLVLIGPDFLWRQNTADGVYTGPIGASFAPYRGSAFIGVDYNIENSWQVTKRFQMRLVETFFEHGSGFQTHGGKNSNYVGMLGVFRL